MNKTQNLLTNNSKYQIILHEAWTQQILNQPFSSNQPIHIFGGENYGDTDNPIWQIDGILNITKNNYFNIKTNLLLTEQKNELPNNLNNIPLSPYSDSLASFTLENSDRMRSNQPYYFDHPLFGMLVLISKSSSNS